MGVEKSMQQTIKCIFNQSYIKYFELKKTDWIRLYPGQVILAVDATTWTSGSETAITENAENGYSLQDYEEKLRQEINEVVIVVRTKLDPMLRFTINAMITLSVH